MAEGSGSWLEYLQFDGKVFWTIDDEKDEWIMSNDDKVPEQAREFLLPSDSQLRADMGPLKAKNFEEAEKQKFDLEELQRKDKRNR